MKKLRVVEYDGDIYFSAKDFIMAYYDEGRYDDIKYFEKLYLKQLKKIK